MIHSTRPDADRRDHRRALELANKAVELEPQASNRWTALGIACYRESQWHEAHIAFEKSLQLGTDSWGGGLRWPDAIDWFFLAMCHHQLDQEDEARQCYEIGVAWMEENQPNSEQLVPIRTEAQELLGAAADLASPVKGELANQAEELASLYFARHEAKAAEGFSQAIELTPDRWEAWNGRASFYFSRKQWDRAVADYSEAIELAPEVHTIWLHRGHSFLQLAQWDKAAADFTKVIEGWPHDTGGWFFRACAYAQLNQQEKAISDLRQAIAEGFTDVEHLKNQPMLNPLRSNDEFKELLAALEAEQSLRSERAR
jgi:tetratricopeptide (TPR) repeat protein